MTAASFLRTAALFTGIANPALYWIATSSEAVIGGDATNWYWPHGLLFVALSGGAGLLTAEVLLRARRPVHEKGFLSRYVLLVLGIMLGGALSGLSLELANLVFYVDAAAGNPLTALLFDAPLLMTLGGLVGLTEGVALALPLAAILGLFRGSTQS